MVKRFEARRVHHGATEARRVVGERLWARGERVRKSYGERVEGEG